MKDLLTDEVRDLPTTPIPVDAVINDGRRRLRRHRATSGTAAFAAVTALAALAVQVVPTGGGGDGALAGTGKFEQRKVSYATASTIHYGGQQIDVSPHQVWSFVQTDDGFVFATESGEVYLADGQAVEQIGDGNAGLDGGLLVADDTGSYVAWTDSESEFVVYDTAAREEVTRTPADDTPTDGVFEDGPYVVAIDGDIVYWRTGQGVVAWDVSTQSGEVRVAHEEQFFVHDVADGQIAQLWEDAADHEPFIVVNDDPDVDEPRLPFAENSHLSPSARYLAFADRFVPPDGRIFDVTTGDDVTPTVRGDYRSVYAVQWIDDDRYVARALPKGTDQVDLLTCSVGDGACALAAPSVGSADDVEFPMGEHGPFIL